jgi:hypothetical protein
MIRLYRTPTGWIADMSAAADAQRIGQLFGTTHIPTPYTAQAPAQVVRAEIARLNPEERVLIATD